MKVKVISLLSSMPAETQAKMLKEAEEAEQDGYAFSREVNTFCLHTTGYPPREVQVTHQIYKKYRSDEPTHQPANTPPFPEGGGSGNEE